MANITTRISLRNDILENWTSSTVLLNKGEVALARFSGDLSDKYEIRIGVGGKTWSELSNGGVQIPSVANDINELSIGLSDEIENRTSALEDLSIALSTALSISIDVDTSPETSSILKTYTIKQGNQEVGTIDIPKDFLVKSAEVKTVTEPDVPYEGAQVGDKYIDFEINAKTGGSEDSHLYIPIKDIVVAYTGGVTDTISATIGSDNAICAIVRAGSITSTELSDGAVTTSKIADSQVTNAKIAESAVNTSQLSAKAVTSEKIADGAVANAQLGLNSVTLDRLSSDVIDHINSISTDNKTYVDSVVSAMSVDWSGSTSQTVVSVAQRDGVVSLSAIDIAISASQVVDLGNVVGNYVPLSVASSSASSTDKLQAASEVSAIAEAYVNTLDVNAIDVGASKTLSTISESDGKISITTVDISIAQSQVNGLENSLDSKLDKQTFNELSNEIGLSAAAPGNPVVTKQDIANLEGAMHFKGAVDALSNVTSANPGDVVIIIDTSKEYVYNGDAQQPYLSTNWIELGDESLYATKGEVSEISGALVGRDNYLSSSIDNKVYVDGLSAQSLSVCHISQDDFHAKVIASALLSNELYVVSSESFNMYGERIINLADPEISSDAATRNYVDTAVAGVVANSLSGVRLNDVDFIVEDNVASLSITEISCGDANG